MKTSANQSCVGKYWYVCFCLRELQPQLRASSAECAGVATSAHKVYFLNVDWHCRLDGVFDIWDRVFGICDSVFFSILDNNLVLGTVCVVKSFPSFVAKH